MGVGEGEGEKSHHLYCEMAVGGRWGIREEEGLSVFRELTELTGADRANPCPLTRDLSGQS